jgi:hypothetical protein
MRHLLDDGWREQLLCDDAIENPPGLVSSLGWQFLPESI